MLANPLYLLNYFFHFTTVLSHWDFFHGKFGLLFPGESQLRQGCATQPTVHVECFSVSIIFQTLTWTTGSLTCAQMLKHATAHGGVRESTGGKNHLPHRGIEPASAACQSDVLQLSYIPAQNLS